MALTGMLVGNAHPTIYQSFVAPKMLIERAIESKSL